jgi:hypothetical protein
MNSEEENSCQFVSSRGILKSCDVHPRNPVSSVRTIQHTDYPPDWISELRPGNSIYVHTSAMPDFVANVFPSLLQSSTPFVLVTGDADALAPNDIFRSMEAAAAFLNSPCLLAWFAQNCVARHSKLVPLPIGLDYHTLMAGRIPWWGSQRTPLEQEAELLMLRQLPLAETVPYRAYSNFHFNLCGRFSYDRYDAIAQVAPSCVYYEPHKITRLESWQRQRTQYRFVLSPLGNGLDCHRTWEALCLGCIPIVHSSPLNSLWEGLPVWVVETWSEVTAEAMEQKAAETRYDSVTGISNVLFNNLRLNTWVERIRQAGTTVR